MKGVSVAAALFSQVEGQPQWVKLNFMVKILPKIIDLPQFWDINHEPTERERET